MSLNLYSYVKRPSELSGFRNRHKIVPEYAYDELAALRHHMTPEQITEFEQAISNDAKYSVNYQ
jgi:hypothetical protein